MAYLRQGKLWAIIALLPAILALSGCGGFSGSHSVSPASFLLPGIVQTQPEDDVKPSVARTAEILDCSILFTNSEPETLVSKSN